MTAPTAPSLASLCTEGLQKVGYTTSSSLWATRLARAETQWMEEIKQDIYQTEKRLKSLMATGVQVTTNGLATYSVPSDFGEDLTITLIDGVHTGALQTGAAGSVTLAASEAIGPEIIGKEIFIYSGTGINQIRNCTGYSDTTKVATVSPNWTVTPVTSDGYMIIDRYKELVSTPVWDFGRTIVEGDVRDPERFIPMGDTDWGEFMVWPSPYRNTGVPWGLKLRYFCDLTRLDLAGTMLATVYQKWRNVWVQGVFAKGCEDIDDSRAPAEMTKYRGMISQMVSRERYGTEITDMRIHVGDYE